MRFGCFSKKKWSLKFSFFKIGFPSLIVYFFVTVFTFFKNPLNIFFQLLFFFGFLLFLLKVRKILKNFGQKFWFSYFRLYFPNSLGSHSDSKNPNKKKYPKKRIIYKTIIWNTKIKIFDQGFSKFCVLLKEIK